MAENPFARGLFVKLEGAAAENPGANVASIKLGNANYDMAPFVNAFAAIGANLTAYQHNPYSPTPLANMHLIAQQLVPHIATLPMHPAARQLVQPMVRGLAQFVSSSQTLIKQRLRTSHHLARAPKILIPVCLNIAAGASATGIQIRNPYLGSSGGQAGQYTSPWTITAYRHGNGESGMLAPIRMTQFLLGGHDYVAASLGGLTYSVTAAPAVLGWPPSAFAETARKIWQSSVQPWNVVALSGEGVGFGSIMTETGLLQLAYNNGGSGTYIDTAAVYCNATLCGNIFGQSSFNDADVMRHAFAPMALQAPMAMQLAQNYATQLIGAIGDDNPRHQLGPGMSWAAGRLGAAGQAIENFLGNPPGDMGDFLEGPPERYGFGLTGGASYMDQ